jgi:beta-lactam-binding protein with PASTA domain
MLNGTGFKAGVVSVPSADPKGSVVSQSPAGGPTRRTGTRIQLNVSLGPDPGTQKVVPDVLGLDPQAARAKLSGAGFNVLTLASRSPTAARTARSWTNSRPAAGARRRGRP